MQALLLSKACCYLIPHLEEVSRLGEAEEDAVEG